MTHPEIKPRPFHDGNSLGDGIDARFHDGQHLAVLDVLWKLLDA